MLLNRMFGKHFWVVILSASLLLCSSLKAQSTCVGTIVSVEYDGCLLPDDPSQANQWELTPASVGMASIVTCNSCADNCALKINVDVQGGEHAYNRHEEALTDAQASVLRVSFPLVLRNLMLRFILVTGRNFPRSYCITLLMVGRMCMRSMNNWVVLSLLRHRFSTRIEWKCRGRERLDTSWTVSCSMRSTMMCFGILNTLYSHTRFSSAASRFHIGTSLGMKYALRLQRKYTQHCSCWWTTELRFQGYPRTPDQQELQTQTF